MGYIDPKIKPLYRDLKDLNIGIYLASTDFDRYALKNGINYIWNKAIETYDRENTVMFITVTDTTTWDREEALRILMNWSIRSSQLEFNAIIFTIIRGFIEWSSKILILDNVFEDLTLAGLPVEKINELTNLHSTRKNLITTIDESFVKLENKQNVTAHDNYIESKRTAWIDQIALGGTEGALVDIKNYASEKNDLSLVKVIANLSSRWHRYNGNYVKGLIKNEDKEMEINKINEALIDLIMSLKQLA